MPVYFKFLWGNPAPIRLALSFAAGIALGISVSGSSVWFLLFLLVLILRTHIISLIFGFATGKLLSTIVAANYESLGKSILLSNKSFWQNFLAKPFICYLNLNDANVMGNLVFALLSGLFFFIILFPVLFYLKKSLLKKYIARRSL